jgi:hypothetical protein
MNDPVSSVNGILARGYNLTFGSGLASPNGSTVPEPSTLVLSSILFGMFGLVWSFKRLMRTTAADCNRDGSAT